MDVEQGSGEDRFGGRHTADTADTPDSRTLPALAQRLSDAYVLAGGGDELVDVVAAAQAVINAATAVQDEAIARLAAIEPEWAEDGTILEVHHAPGHVALDAADIVAPALAASHAQAQRRVDLAVRLAAGRVPRVDDTRALPEPTGLDGLHDAMCEGRLDGYRAGVVAHELAEAPAEVAETVVAALDPHLGREPAAALRRRCRRLLARISPDLLRQRADRARSECGLRRWVTEPGVDTWWGTFPSEDAAASWAAIDDLARRLVADGVCTGVEQARARALTDLVLAHSTVTVSVVLTVPAGGSATSGVAPIGSGDDLVEVRGLRPSEPSLVPRSWLDAHLAPGSALVECDAKTGARLDSSSTHGYRPSASMKALVRARDGRCRFPGCSVAARFCDLDHVRPWPAGPTAADNLVCLCRRHHRIKQRPGWRVRMMPGAVLEWTDPTGRLRETVPVDALAAVVLRPADEVSVPSSGVGDAATALFSLAELALEHLVGPGAAPPRGRRIEHSYRVGTRVRVRDARPGRHAWRVDGTRRRTARWPDLPPF